jgi:hypothetical protein
MNGGRADRVWYGMGVGSREEGGQAGFVWRGAGRDQKGVEKGESERQGRQTDRQSVSQSE